MSDDLTPPPSASAPEGGAGTVTAPYTPAQEPTKQTAAQKRAATLAKKKAAAAKRAAAREERARSAAEQPAAKPEPEAEPIADELDDKTLRENLAAGLNVLWLVAQLVAGLFGRKLRDYEDAEREADAKAWLPLARRMPSLGRVAGWVGAPVRFVQRFREKLEPKKADA